MRFFVLFIFSFLLVASSLFAENTARKHELDHEAFIKKITSSQDDYFDEIVERYNTYLQLHPSDINIYIEKCKFIELAQYDYYDEYNPNQNLYDTESAKLFKRFPKAPQVLVYKIESLWGDDLAEALEDAEKIIKKDNRKWSDEQVGSVYSKIAYQHYNNKEFNQAYTYAKKTIRYDKEYKGTIDYARILLEVGKDTELIQVLSLNNDTSSNAWQLGQKAELLLGLDQFDKALEIYELINIIDSSYSNNKELAVIMNNLGKHNEARFYLLKDTTASLWNKSVPALSLFQHDLKYHSADTALASYNSYRDLG